MGERQDWWVVHWVEAPEDGEGTVRASAEFMSEQAARHFADGLPADAVPIVEQGRAPGGTA